MTVIETERLRLLPLTTAELSLLIPHTHELEKLLDVTIARSMLAGPVPQAIAVKLQRMVTAEPAMQVWVTYWLLIERETAFGVGLMGFKGVPDVDGAVEIGYGVDGGQWGRGFATEAARALVAWALSRPECRSVLAEVHLNNPASMRVLEKCGFVAERETATSRYYRATWRSRP